MNFTKLLPGLFIALLGSETLSFAADAKTKTERQTVTFIQAEGKLDGSTDVAREAVKECIVSLPKPEDMEPEVVSDSRFLKEINGESNKNDWMKTFEAKITVNYMVFKKDLLIVATKSVEGKDPIFKDVEKRLPKSVEFVSNPADGGTFAGRSNRQYYFTKQEDAVKDVRARALVWLKQQLPLLCSDH